MNIEEFKEKLARLGVDWAIVNGKICVPCPLSDHEGNKANILIGISTDSGQCDICGQKTNFVDCLTALEAKVKVERVRQAETKNKERGASEKGTTSFKMQLLRVADILGMDFPDDEWLVEHLIPLPSVIALSGVSGHGKTWVTIHIAQCVANGLPVFGKFSSKAARVLIINEEDYPKHLKKRFQSLGVTEKDGITYLSLVGFKADNPKQIDEIIALINEEGFKLVIIDSMIRIHDQDENDARGMAKVSRGLRQLAKGGVAVLFTHHHRKQDASKPNNATQSLRGSSDIQAGVENHFMLERKEDEDVLVFRQPKSRNAEALKPFEVRILKSHNEIIGFEYIGDHDEKKTKAATAKEAIVELLKNEGIKSRPQILEALKQRGIGERAIDDGIHEAELAGEIELVKREELPPELQANSRQRHYRIKIAENESVPPL
jgi:KaiC/GvpD/RAD55 family RecA-like ATPase